MADAAGGLATRVQSDAKSFKGIARRCGSSRLTYCSCIDIVFHGRESFYGVLLR